MPGSTYELYWHCQLTIKKIWGERPYGTDFQTFWRGEDEGRLPKLDVLNFFRGEISFGRETILGFGAGNGQNLRAQFGSVRIVSYTARQKHQEEDNLYWLGVAMDAFRGVRRTDDYGNHISFIGEGSGFDVEPIMEGNWYARGALQVFEYRFLG